MSTSESKVFCSVWHCNDLLIYKIKGLGNYIVFTNRQKIF